MTGLPGIRPIPDLPPGPRAALIIATTDYQDEELNQLRATADDAQALTEVLGNPGVGGFTVTSVIDGDERQVRRAIDAFLSGRDPGDVVLVYLSCHGVLDRRGRLYFAAADTFKDRLSSTGIQAAWLLDQLEECRARQQVVILDCCFSGAFAKGSKGDGQLDLERRLAGTSRGRAVLTASRSEEYSFTGDALPGAAVFGSVFTAGLVAGLRTGEADADGDGYVNVDEAYDFAYRYVLALRAAQTPQRWLSGGEGAIVLARSPSGIVITAAPLEPARRVPDRTARLLADAERAAWSVGSPWEKASALAEIAKAVAATNPDHAARLIADAERIAQSKSMTLGLEKKPSVLAEIAKAVAATNPDHAARLLADAERDAQSINDVGFKASALNEVASAVSATNPEHAERIAQTIPEESHRARALTEIAKAVAATNPDHAARLLADAERNAQSIRYSVQKASVLAEIAKAVAATNPDHAARLLADAGRIAESITERWLKSWVLAEIAKAVAATNPDYAARLLRDAESIAQATRQETYRGWALSSVAKAVAATDPERALRIAQTIPDERHRASALSFVAKALAATNPDHAEHIAQTVPNERYRASALTEIAIAAF